MASSVIHMAVASEVNKKIKRDNGRLLIGSIAPDISKFLGESKLESHFLDTLENNNNIPNIDRFLDKYKKNLADDFVMGYFIHLYTDYLWFKYFITGFYENDHVTKLDGSVFKCSNSTLCLYIYNDYTNMNSKLLDEYDMDLSIFYNEPPEFEDIIKEIPMDKISLIIDKASIIIENSKVRKDLVFDIEDIKKFIETSTDLILGKIEELTSNKK